MAGPSRSALALLLVLSLPAAAFLGGRPRSLPAADFTLVLPKEVSILDPAQATAVADGWMIQALFEGLLRLDPVTLEPRPAAAESFTVSEDGLTYTFTLRPDLRWSDGTPLAARDFAASWRRALDPVQGSSLQSLFSQLDRDSIEALDPRTFRFRLTSPCAAFAARLAHFSLMPVRTDLVEMHGESFTEPGKLVGNGPYRLAERRLRDRLRLERNEHYHGAAAVRIGVIDALTVESGNTALNLFLTGAADWVNAVPPAALPGLAGRPELRLNTVLATTFLRFNVTRAPLGDVRVRRAIDLAIDRAALCRHVYRSGDRPARSLVPPELPGYASPTPPAGGLADARRLLAEAGFPGGAGFPELELLHAAGDAHRQAADALAATLATSLGIRLRPAPQEHKVSIDSQRELRYDVCLAVWVGDYLGPGTFLDLFQSDHRDNRTGWRSASYDRLLAAAAAEPDPGANARLLGSAEELLLAEGPIAPIAFRGQANLVASHVDGFTTNLLDLHPLDLLSTRPAPGGNRRP